MQVSAGEQAMLWWVIGAVLGGWLVGFAGGYPVEAWFYVLLVLVMVAVAIRLLERGIGSSVR
jgi:hypothetical protein